MLNTIQNCCLFSSPPHLREQNIEKCPRHSCSYTMCCHLCLQSNVHYVLCQQYCSLCCINCVRIGLTLSLFKTATIYVTLTATHLWRSLWLGLEDYSPFVPTLMLCGHCSSALWLLFCNVGKRVKAKRGIKIQKSSCLSANHHRSIALDDWLTNTTTLYHRLLFWSCRKKMVSSSEVSTRRRLAPSKPCSRKEHKNHLANRLFRQKATTTHKR